MSAAASWGVDFQPAARGFRHLRQEALLEVSASRNQTRAISFSAPHLAASPGSPEMPLEKKRSLKQAEAKQIRRSEAAALAVSAHDEAFGGREVLRPEAGRGSERIGVVSGLQLGGCGIFHSATSVAHDVVSPPSPGCPDLSISIPIGQGALTTRLPRQVRTEKGQLIVTDPGERRHFSVEEHAETIILRVPAKSWHGASSEWTGTSTTRPTTTRPWSTSWRATLDSCSVSPHPRREPRRRHWSSISSTSSASSLRIRRRMTPFI